ncbi:hypothetical protein AB6A40_006364 [Gnathostoma spinigerum]|uniref:Uncharacterized protein n=1 Tax=Gnathostoma spinigerum TaxID=75299 RepID=A0ABD6EI62_9BILA
MKQTMFASIVATIILFIFHPLIISDFDGQLLEKKMFRSCSYNDFEIFLDSCFTESYTLRCINKVKYIPCNIDPVLRSTASLNIMRSTSRLNEKLLETYSFLSMNENSQSLLHLFSFASSCSSQKRSTIKKPDAFFFELDEIPQKSIEYRMEESKSTDDEKLAMKTILVVVQGVPI